VLIAVPSEAVSHVDSSSVPISHLLFRPGFPLATLAGRAPIVPDAVALGLSPGRKVVT
jgi:hypothetical protein